MTNVAEKPLFEPKTKPVVFFRLAVQRIGVFWFYLLRSWVKSWEPSPLKDSEMTIGRKKFRQKNTIFQVKLSRIFLPYYYFCPDCTKEGCCRIFGESAERCPAPVSVVDGIIYDLPLEKVTRNRSFKLGEVAAGLRRQFSFLGSQPSSGAKTGGADDLLRTYCHRLPTSLGGAAFHLCFGFL